MSQHITVTPRRHFSLEHNADTTETELFRTGVPRFYATMFHSRERQRTWAAGQISFTRWGLAYRVLPKNVNTYGILVFNGKRT